MTIEQLRKDMIAAAKAQDKPRKEVLSALVSDGAGAAHVGHRVAGKYYSVSVFEYHVFFLSVNKIQFCRNPGSCPDYRRTGRFRDPAEDGFRRRFTGKG